MSFQFSKKLKIISLHLGLIATTFCLLLAILFHIVLPAITRHQQAILVPDLKKLPIEECKKVLEKIRLRYNVGKELGYFPQYPPGVVIEQHPQAGAYVKKDRTIYLTLNASQALSVPIPHLIDGSVRNAYLTLKGYGLVCGPITYVPDVVKGAVLEQHYQGKPIAPGEKIRQGSTIELVVGTGLKDSLAKVPSLMGRTAEEAVLALLDAGLCLGKVSHQLAEGGAKGTIIQQLPAADDEATLGTAIDVWVAKEG
jgi:beta-lactam-binding protein with PASTA domain